MNRATDDLIPRAAAIEAFDDKRVERNYGDVSPESVIRVIESIPAVDAAPIVRCKDCKHRPTITRGTDGDAIIFPDWRCPIRCDDDWYNWYPDDDWFCGDGDRREVK